MSNRMNTNNFNYIKNKMSFRDAFNVNMRGFRLTIQIMISISLNIKEKKNTYNYAKYADIQKY